MPAVCVSGQVMYFDPPLQEARLLRRYKRFLADVETPQGELLTIHCANTGSMLNCQGEGARLWFSRSQDPRRKLPGTWELVETPQGRLACVNTARANALVEEALLQGVISELAGFTRLRREVPFGEENSRVDFCLDCPGGPAYVEVKSVTLGFANSPLAAFPDARSVRACKHLRELARLAQQGVRAVQLYCVNLSGVDAVRVAEEIDPAYAAECRRARDAGVEFLAYASHLDVQGVWLRESLPVSCA